MGSITSKQNPEALKNIKNGSNDVVSQNVTPKPVKTLPFDPRSPSEYINRTPITVSDSSEGNTPNVRMLKALPLDPRSPTTEVTRTPLYVEENYDKRRYQPTKPSKLTDICFSNNTQSIDKDPRSPTEKVPRTPLEEGSIASSREPFYEEEPLTPPNTQRDLTNDPRGSLNRKLFETLDKDRKPLTDVQNQPKNQIQALQCRNVEEEFAKNEKLILNKLETNDQTIKTSTEFIENI
ncbi:UNVERIFIED_CONTAM: hypothetical protein RMT77_005317 [Armadillidium vulgare]